ncbi:MAG: DUF1835 domain-containing protein [Bacteroidia bacterium]|nr:DUF1835 domain-containing protein [Bacteroidia bacterium]
MTYHILNGDALLQELGQANLPGDFLVCRECLVDGPVAPLPQAEFWQARARFLEPGVPDHDGRYYNKVVPQFLQMLALPSGAEVNLWFEDDLFCQTNMWYVLHLLSERPDLLMFRVFPALPPEADHWRGFGASSPALLADAWTRRVLLTPADRKLGEELWKAYSTHQLSALAELSKRPSSGFHALPEVCEAHILRFGNAGLPGRPNQFVAERVRLGATFGEIFREFCQKEGIYGFGDLQLLRIYEKSLADLAGNMDE